MYYPEYQLSYTVTGATASVATGNVHLHNITIPKALVGTFGVYDTSNTLYFALPTGTAAGTLSYDCVLANGLQTVQSSAADQIATTYKKT